MQAELVDSVSPSPSPQRISWGNSLVLQHLMSGITPDTPEPPPPINAKAKGKVGKGTTWFNWSRLPRHWAELVIRLFWHPSFGLEQIIVGNDASGIRKSRCSRLAPYVIGKEFRSRASVHWLNELQWYYDQVLDTTSRDTLEARTRHLLDLKQTNTQAPSPSPKRKTRYSSQIPAKKHNLHANFTAVHFNLTEESSSDSAEEDEKEASEEDSGRDSEDETEKINTDDHPLPNAVIPLPDATPVGKAPSTATTNFLGKLDHKIRQAKEALAQQETKVKETKEELARQHEHIRETMNRIEILQATRNNVAKLNL